MPDWIPFTSALDPTLWLSLGIILLGIGLINLTKPLYAFGLGAIFQSSVSAPIPNWLLSSTWMETTALITVWVATSLVLWMILLLVFKYAVPPPVSES